MPFKSEAQRGFMYAKHPKIAKRFEKETSKDADLPEHIKKMNKGGMAGDWKEDLAGYMDQHFGGEQSNPQHMADGGFAGDVDMSDSLMAGYNPPAAPSAPFDLKFNPNVGLPYGMAPTPAPAPAPSVAPVKQITSTPNVPVMPPSGSTGPDPLQDYLAQQKSQLNKYGPEEQLALEQQIQKERTGFMPNLALAGAGFADALMQGVAQQGSGNFEASLENRMDRSQEGRRQALQRAQTGNLAKMKQEMELAQADPQSPLSRSVQRSNAKTLAQMGYSPDDIGIIPASLMSDVLAKRLTLEQIREEAGLKRATLENTAAYQKSMLHSSAQKEAFDEQEKIQQRQLEAAKETEKRDVAPKFHLFGSDIPYWTSPVSRAERRGARQVIRGQVAGTPTTTPASSPASNNFASEAEAKSSGLPSGSIILINGRRARLH